MHSESENLSRSPTGPLQRIWRKMLGVYLLALQSSFISVERVMEAELFIYVFN